MKHVNQLVTNGRKKERDSRGRHAPRYFSHISFKRMQRRPETCMSPRQTTQCCYLVALCVVKRILSRLLFLENFFVPFCGNSWKIIHHPRSQCLFKGKAQGMRLMIHHSSVMTLKTLLSMT